MGQANRTSRVGTKISKAYYSTVLQVEDLMLFSTHSHDLASSCFRSSICFFSKILGTLPFDL